MENIEPLTEKRMSGNKLIIVLFLTVLTLISTISFGRLLIFYINEELDYNEWYPELGGKLETDLNSNLWMKISFVNMNGALRNVLGQREMNGVVKLDNGYLYSPEIETKRQELVDMARVTGEFNDSVSEMGIQYIYITVPQVNDKYDDKLPAGIDDYGNDNLDNLNIFLHENGVETLDLRERLHEEGMTSADVMYRTDHHWTMEGAFWGYNELMGYLEATNDDIHVDERIGDISNYTIEKYPAWHLGSFGQRVGRFFGGIDDFDLILPAFDTYVEPIGSGSGGTIEQMMIDRTPLQSKNYMSRYTYDKVTQRSEGRWHNPNAPIKKTVLIMADSFGRAFIPFLAMTFENVVRVEVQSIDKEIETYQPDIILTMRSHDTAVDDYFYDWPEL